MFVLVESDSMFSLWFKVVVMLEHYIYFPVGANDEGLDLLYAYLRSG
jgi:hypothetical protein